MLILIYIQLLDLVVLALFGVIQNFAMFAESRCYFQYTRFVDILALYLRKTKPDISLLAVITLSMLINDIYIEKRGILVFDEEAILEYIRILQQAVTQEDLTARNIFGSLVVPAEDILSLLKQLWHIEANHGAIIKLYSSLMPLLETCLKRGKDVHHIATLDLLWTLSTDPDLLSTAAETETLIAVLVSMFIDDTTNDQVRSMSRCIFYKLNSYQVEGIDVFF